MRDMGATMSDTYKVLSVEDDDLICELVKATLRPLPILFYQANNGPDAIKIATEVRPDVLILDINLPGMHGWEVLKQLVAQNMNFRGVIMLTAQTSATHRVIAHLQDEVTHFLGKPFDPQDLREAVEQTLNLSS